ncbi:hypothetical protein RHIZ404_200175 [Rhizobium sp. EC-SD404]|nr:hypothetical protein RHIZ404_200175 [Rhizobium sp. EC-SD404]
MAFEFVRPIKKKNKIANRPVQVSRDILSR